MNELENIILTIDTREQNQKRIQAVESWATKHGAIVEHSALKLCDYHLEGEFRGKPVSLGIEAKSLPDFATSFQDLPDKLARSFSLYKDVALFVEVNSYTFVPDENDFHCTVRNPAVPDREADVLPLAVLENMLASFQGEGVHVRQLRSEYHFPYAVANLLISVSKEEHTGLWVKSSDYSAQYFNLLLKLPGVGPKKAQVLRDAYPNLFWLCSASTESIQDVIGKLNGNKLQTFLHNHELETDAWKNGYHQNGTKKECRFADEKNKAVCTTPDNFKHSCHPIDDQQGNPSSKLCSLQPITPADSSHVAGNQKIPPPPTMANPSTDTHVCMGQRPLTRHASEEVSGLSSLDIGLDNNKHEYKEVTANKNGYRMSLKEHLKTWFNQPHTMQETIDNFKDWQPGRVFDMVMGGCTAGYLVKFDNGTIIKSRIWEERKKEKV